MINSIVRLGDKWLGAWIWACIICFLLGFMVGSLFTGAMI